MHFRLNVSDFGYRAGNLTVKCCCRRLYIRIQPQIANSQSKYTQDVPANEAEVQTEQPPTVSCHQLFGTGNGFTGRKLRLLRQDEFCHRIAVCGDNAGDDQQQGPQQDVEALKKTAAAIVFQ